MTYTNSLLFLSNMTPSKGYMDVLHATRLLLEDGYDVYTDFVGRWESDGMPVLEEAFARVKLA